VIHLQEYYDTPKPSKPWGSSTVDSIASVLLIAAAAVLELLDRALSGRPPVWLSGSITGWKDLSDERKAAYRGLVAPYLLEIDRETAVP
jgi:hypothetical protein